MKIEGQLCIGPLQSAWYLPESMWFRIFNRGLNLRFPGSFHYFSERYGYRKPLLSIGDFRVFYLKSHD